MNVELIDIVLLLAFFAELALLLHVEKRLWHTLYTPLAAAAIPYTGVLLITICMPESSGIYPFYYPSLFVWMIGLIMMAIPSWLLASVVQKNETLEPLCPDKARGENVLLSIIGILLVLFAFHLRSMISSSANMFGSDEFGEDFATYGLFGHLLSVLIAGLIVLFGSIRKGFRWLPIMAIILITAMTFVNQVKSWVIIPLIAGFWLCLETQKIKLSAKLVLSIVIGGTVLFFASYLTNFIIGNQLEYDDHMGEYLQNHFVHYLLSGVMGFSEDCRMGILETPDPKLLFTPFINAYQLLAGGDFISPVNPHFIPITIENTLGDNVRTMFGTIYIYGDVSMLIIYPLLLSGVLYSIRIAAHRTHSLYICAIDAWFCALLAMGWFEFYFFHLTAFEVPIVLWVMYGVSRLTRRKEVVAVC